MWLNLMIRFPTEMSCVVSVSSWNSGSGASGLCILCPVCSGPSRGSCKLNTCWINEWLVQELILVSKSLVHSFLCYITVFIFLWYHLLNSIINNSSYFFCFFVLTLGLSEVTLQAPQLWPSIIYPLFKNVTCLSLPKYVWGGENNYPLFLKAYLKSISSVKWNLKAIFPWHLAFTFPKASVRLSSVSWKHHVLLLGYWNCVSTQSFPGGSDDKESACNAGDTGLIPGSGRFPWRRKWQPTPVFLPGESPEEPGGLQSMGSQRVGHNWATGTQSFMEGVLPSMEYPGLSAFFLATFTYYNDFFTYLFIAMSSQDRDAILYILYHL